MSKVNEEKKSLVNKNKNDEIICPKCGEKIKFNTKKIEEIIISNKRIQDEINIIKFNIENIIKNSKINILNTRLKNITLLLKTINENIIKNNEKIYNLSNENISLPKNNIISKNNSGQNKIFSLN